MTYNENVEYWAGGMSVDYLEDKEYNSEASEADVWAMMYAGITQLAECQICNLNVVGANPTTGSWSGMV